MAGEHIFGQQDKPVEHKRRFIPTPSHHAIEIRARRRLIRETMEAWIECDPVGAAAASRFLHEISKVEHKKMRTEAASKAGMQLQMRFPQELFLLLRSTFAKFLPDQEMFAHDDSDWDLCYAEFPQFCPKRRH